MAWLQLGLQQIYHDIMDLRFCNSHLEIEKSKFKKKYWMTIVEISNGIIIGMPNQRFIRMINVFKKI